MQQDLDRVRRWRRDHPADLQDDIGGPVSGHGAATTIRDALIRRGVPAATVALPGAATVVTGRIDGSPGRPRIGLYAPYDTADRSPITALLGALDALAGAQPTATMVFLFEGEGASGSPGLPEYLDTLADRLAAEVWVASGDDPGIAVRMGPDEPVARILTAAALSGFPTAAASATDLIGARLGCPVVSLPGAGTAAWMDLLAVVLG
jgi:hypothetical protein